MPNDQAKALQRLQEIAEELKTRKALEDIGFWRQNATQTKDEQAAIGVDPYRPFPAWPFFVPLDKLIEIEPVVFVEKSRTMMMSWWMASVLAHGGFTAAARQMVIQSEDEERSVNLLDKVKVLWERSLPRFKERCPLQRDMVKQAYNRLDLNNASEFLALVGSPQKLNSLHPTYVGFDEAALMTQFLECYTSAVAARARIMAVTSAFPGEFRDFTVDAVPVDWPGAEQRACDIKPHHPDCRDEYFDTLTVKAPCYGLSLRRTKQGIAVARLHITAIPEITPEFLSALRAKSASEAHYQREVNIVYEALEGAKIYPDFDPRMHVVDDDAIPKKLSRYMAIDPHPRTPHAALWIGLDQAGDYWVYREFWPSVVYGRNQNASDQDAERMLTSREYAERLTALERNELRFHYKGTDQEYAEYIEKPHGERILARYMDTAGKAFKVSGEGLPIETYNSRYRQYGIFCLDPNRSHEAGEDAIRELLKPRPHDVHGMWPKLHIARSCVELQLEFMRARYKTMVGTPQTHEVQQRQVEVRTHLIDCLRYLATAPLAWSPRTVS